LPVLPTLASSRHLSDIIRQAERLPPPRPLPARRAGMPRRYRGRRRGFRRRRCHARTQVPLQRSQHPGGGQPATAANLCAHLHAFLGFRQAAANLALSSPRVATLGAHNCWCYTNLQRYLVASLETDFLKRPAIWRVLVLWLFLGLFLGIMRALH